MRVHMWEDVSARAGVCVHVPHARISAGEWQKPLSSPGEWLKVKSLQVGKLTSWALMPPTLGIPWEFHQLLVIPSFHCFWFFNYMNLIAASYVRWFGLAGCSGDWLSSTSFAARYRWCGWSWEFIMISLKMKMTKLNLYLQRTACSLPFKGFHYFTMLNIVP